VRAFARLRWQLTLSHLLATVFTLLSMIAAVMLIASTWLASQSNTSTSREPATDARSVAGVITGIVQNGEDPVVLNSVLRAIADGSLHAVFSFGPPAWRADPNGMGLRDIAYIVVLDPAGRVIGSSDPSGAAFAPAESNQWRTLAADADPNGSMLMLNGGGPAALGAAPIFDSAGHKLADAVVAKSVVAPPTPSGGFDLLRGLAIFGAASVAVLAAASIFALVSSSLVAYLLSRRLVRRLERLGKAAESLAAGDLSQRVDAGADEVGQLAQRFNNMAADLERTLGDLRAERDRVAGLLDQRRQLVANASHELRTPVATVRGYLESALARPDELPDGLRTDLATMEHELSRLQQLIDDLFALSQAAVGRLSMRLEPTDAGAVVKRLVETTAPLAWRQRQVQVLGEYEQDTPLARADAQRLEQIVSNLLGNAVRHTPPGGLVAAVVSTEPALVRVDVRDTGEGITADEVPHLFERFFRGNGQNGAAGAGLGLALVKELTEAMGGSVEANSTPGEGSCFTIRLPVS
jgi:signal transduction histidine kinase